MLFPTLNPILTSLVIFLAFTTGCAPAYLALKSESSNSTLHTFVDAAANCRHEPHKVDVSAASGEQFQVAVYDYGSLDATHTYVLIHGVLSDARVWRFVVGPLAEENRVLVIDLPGCGESGMPQNIRNGAFSPTSLASVVLQAVQATEQQHASRITLVGHSLGGMIALRMMSDVDLQQRHRTVLERVDGLVLFAPVHVAVERKPAAFDSIEGLNMPLVAVADATGLLKQKVAQATRDGVMARERALKEEADRTIETLRHPIRRKAAITMIKQAVPRHGNRPDWARIHQLEEDYARVNRPCLIVWGDCDETLPRSMAHLLRDQLPEAKVRTVRNAMHTVPIEYPELTLRILQEFEETRFTEIPVFATMSPQFGQR